MPKSYFTPVTTPSARYRKRWGLRTPNTFPDLLKRKKKFPLQSCNAKDQKPSGQISDGFWSALSAVFLTLHFNRIQLGWYLFPWWWIRQASQSPCRGHCIRLQGHCFSCFVCIFPPLYLIRKIVKSSLISIRHLSPAMSLAWQKIIHLYIIRYICILYKNIA